MSSLVFSLVCMSSCVNSIAEKNSETGPVPIHLSTSVQSRVLNNQFEEGDSIGIFMLSGKYALSSKRYMDNVPFFSKTAKPVSGETLYYPAGNEMCKFISYYPYRKDAIPGGTNELSISVASDQQSDASYSHSDFLIARKDSVVPSDKEVLLDHQHGCSLLNIVLVPSGGSSVKELLAANPVVTVNGLYTQCMFNMENSAISQLSRKQRIVPKGKWQESEGRLIGKAAILIPQKIMKGSILFNIEIEGRRFVSRVNEDFDFQVKKNNTITVPCSKFGVGTMNISISDWEKGKDGLASLESCDDEIYLSSLSFNDSWVYNVYQGETLVAKICKEYLLSDNINAQAIVAYPVTKNEMDLSNGMVLKLLGKQSQENGGKIEWNKADNKLKYTAGSQNSTEIVYVDNKRRFSFVKPDTALTVEVVPDVLYDIRGEEKIRYPLVKIGTQVWTASSLKATKYTDGSIITERKEFPISDKSAARFVSNNGDTFYNFGVVNSGKISPEGWKIPNKTEWQLLWNYVDESAKYKTGEWKTSTATSTNETGFSAVSMGYVFSILDDDTKGEFHYEKESNSFWVMSADKEQGEGKYGLWDKAKNAVYRTFLEVECYSIRFIKK